MWFAYVAYTGIAPISGIYYGIGSSEMIKLLSFRKNDTAVNKKSELRSMTSLLESKINQGKEVTLIVVESH